MGEVSTMAHAVADFILQHRYKDAIDHLILHPDISGKDQHNGCTLFDLVLNKATAGTGADVLAARLFYPSDILELVIDRRWSKTLELVLHHLDGPISFDYMVRALTPRKWSRDVVALLAQRVVPTALQMLNLSRGRVQFLLKQGGVFATFGAAVVRGYLDQGLVSVAFTILTSCHVTCTLDILFKFASLNHFVLKHVWVGAILMKHMDIGSICSDGRTLLETVCANNTLSNIQKGVIVKLLAIVGASFNPSGIGPSPLLYDTTLRHWLVVRTQPLSDAEYRAIANQLADPIQGIKPESRMVYHLCRAFHGRAIERYCVNTIVGEASDPTMSRFVSLMLCTSINVFMDFQPFVYHFKYFFVRRWRRRFGEPTVSQLNQCIVYLTRSNYSQPAKNYVDDVRRVLFPYWSVVSHAYHPPILRQQVHTMMLVFQRLDTLPSELWIYMLTFLKTQ